MLGEEAQHVFFVGRSVAGMRFLGNESMAQPSSAVPRTTSMATGTIAFVAVRVTFGWSGVESGSAFITPVMLAMASTPLSARMTPTKETHVSPQIVVLRTRDGADRDEVRSRARSVATMSTAGIASQMETLPLCFGPK